LIKLLNKPMYDDFLNSISSSKEEIRICSPFIKNDIVNSVFKEMNKNCKISFVTNVNLKSLLKKSSDINALHTILHNNGVLFNYQRLHAKIYVFDNREAIVTSANLTLSGMKRNFEYGIFTDDKEVVKNIIKDFDSLCTGELSGNIKPEHIDYIQKIIDSIPKQREIDLPKLKIDYSEDIEDIYDDDITYIESNLTGWKKAVFIALRTIDKQVFTSSDFATIIPFLKEKYPNNNNIQAKIRQQLQELRDLGLIKFEGNGVYKKLWI